MSDKKNILIIEGEKSLAQMYQLQLDKEFNVIFAKDSIEIEAALGNEPTDIVLLDLEIPGTSGLEVLRKINSLDNWKVVPIVALSNMSSPELQEFTLGLGAKEFINKTDLDVTQLPLILGKYL